MPCRVFVLRKSLMVCGAAGFIGSNFIRHMLDAGWHVLSLDKLTYAGLRENLSPLDECDRHCFVHGSINDAALMGRLLKQHRPLAIVNLAAESHVDRSIDTPESFVETNVMGVFTLLEAVRAYLAESGELASSTFRFLQVSTDEVFGSVESGAFTEESAFRPNSPYAASKASGDCLVRAYHRTYGLPAMISYCSNNYGPFQFPEKLIPLMISKALAGKPLPIYGDGRHRRDWLHVADHCTALEAIIDAGTAGEVYNIGGGCCVENLELVRRLCATLDRLAPRTSGEHFDAISHVEDRPGHDRHYEIDHSKITALLGWRPSRTLEEGLEETVRWYLDNGPWIEIAHSRGYEGQRLGLGVLSGANDGD